MTMTPQTAAPVSLDSLIAKWRESSDYWQSIGNREGGEEFFEARRAIATTYADCADELATLRATLAQPGAVLTDTMVEDAWTAFFKSQCHGHASRINMRAALIAALQPPSEVSP